MDKNQIRGSQCRTSEHGFAKSISIKGTGCKSGGRALKAVELTSGGLSSVLTARLRTGVIHPDRAGGVSRGHSSPRWDEGLNGEEW